MRDHNTPLTRRPYPRGRRSCFMYPNHFCHFDRNEQRSCSGETHPMGRSLRFVRRTPFGRDDNYLSKVPTAALSTLYSLLCADHSTKTKHRDGCRSVSVFWHSTLGAMHHPLRYIASYRGFHESSVSINRTEKDATTPCLHPHKFHGALQDGVLALYVRHPGCQVARATKNTRVIHVFCVLIPEQCTDPKSSCS